MSRDTSDTSDTTELPKVVVFKAGSKIPNLQDYKNVTVVQEIGPGLSSAEFFNKRLQEEDIQDDVIYGFMGENADYMTERAVSIIVNVLGQGDEFGCLYSDILLSTDSTLTRQYLPAFHPNLLSGKIMINSPLFIKGESLNKSEDLKFNENLNVFYMHLFFVQASRTIFSTHVADPLFILTQDGNTTVDAAKEITIIQQCLGL